MNQLGKGYGEVKNAIQESLKTEGQEEKQLKHDSEVKVWRNCSDLVDNSVYNQTQCRLSG